MKWILILLTLSISSISNVAIAKDQPNWMQFQHLSNNLNRTLQHLNKELVQQPLKVVHSGVKQTQHNFGLIGSHLPQLPQLTQQEVQRFFGHIQGGLVNIQHQIQNIKLPEVKLELPDLPF